jgi:hypothetical protein
MGEDRGDRRSRTILGALGLTITLNDDVGHDLGGCSLDDRMGQFYRSGTAVRCAAAALHRPFSKTRVAVKSIFGVMG